MTFIVLENQVKSTYAMVSQLPFLNPRRPILICHIFLLQIIFRQFTLLVVSAISKEKAAKVQFLIPLMSMVGSGPVQEILGCLPLISHHKKHFGATQAREYLLVFSFFDNIFISKVICRPLQINF